MQKFHTKSPTDSKIDEWIAMEVNVHLFGEKGTGKTTRILEGFKRNGLKYTYFSGSTLDPWVHVIGVPKAKENKKTGKEYLDFILPPEMDEELEAIFIDEYNRTPAVVRNALLELVQFGSINGRKFPKLKRIWAASNPPKDEEQGYEADYDVENLDPAQLDRFDIIVEVPNTPDKAYFKQKYGEYKTKILMDWWKEQPKKSKEILSPRRLDKVAAYHDKGGDISEMLPVSCNIKKLIEELSKDEKTAILQTIFDNPDEDSFKMFVAQADNFLKYKEKFKDRKFWLFYKHVDPEFVDAMIKDDTEFLSYAFYQSYASNDKDFYRERIKNVSKTMKGDPLTKTLSVLDKHDKIKDMTKDKIQPREYGIAKLPSYGEDAGNKGPSGIFVSDYTFNRLDKNNYNSRLTLNTQERQKFIQSIMNTFRKEPIIPLVSLMVHCYESFQASSIQKIKNFENLFASIVERASKELPENICKQMAKDIAQVPAKVSCHKQILDVLLNVKGNPSNNSGISNVPKQFLETLTTTMQIVKLAL